MIITRLCATILPVSSHLAGYAVGAGWPAAAVVMSTFAAAVSWVVVLIVLEERRG